MNSTVVLVIVFVFVFVFVFFANILLALFSIHPFRSVEGRKKKLHVSCEEISNEKKNKTKGIPFAAIDQRVIISPPRYLLVGEKKTVEKETM